ncbi:hypothetical protein AAC387_Pa07g0604 [Persea americana]
MCSSGGVCRWESTFNTMKSRVLADSSNSNQAKLFSNGLDMRKGKMGDKKSKQEKERAEKVMHLILWGPK